MSELLIVVDRSEVVPGKAHELKAAVKGLVEFVEANEQRPISYNVFFDENGTHMTVVQVHPDSASIESHLDVTGPLFIQLGPLLTLIEMDVYGTPSQALLDRLRSKVRMLGTGVVRVHELHAGFVRLDGRSLWPRDDG